MRCPLSVRMGTRMLHPLQGGQAHGRPRIISIWTTPQMQIFRQGVIIIIIIIIIVTEPLLCNWHSVSAYRHYNYFCQEESWPFSLNRSEFLFLFFKITALFTCNLHVIKFTPLKCKIQWFLVCSNKSCSYHHYPIAECFHHPKRNILICPSLLSFWQLLIYFLSLWMCLFWAFYINGIKYVIFFVWFLSLSILCSRFIHL